MDIAALLGIWESTTNAVNGSWHSTSYAHPDAPVGITVPVQQVKLHTPISSKTWIKSASLIKSGAAI